MTSSPETPDHTGNKISVDTLKTRQRSKQFLETFDGSSPEQIGLPIILRDYLELVDRKRWIFREGVHEKTSQY